MPYALCPMPYALCPLIKRAPHVTEKGYIKFYLPKQKAPLFLGALFVKSKAKFSR